MHFPIRALAECLFLCHFYPTLSICDQVIPCLKIIFLKTISSLVSFLFHFVVGPLSRVRPRNGILALGLVVLVVLVLVLVLSLRSEFIGEL